jgi:hypothetical protein
MKPYGFQIVHEDVVTNYWPIVANSQEDAIKYFDTLFPSKNVQIASITVISWQDATISGYKDLNLMQKWRFSVAI